MDNKYEYIKISTLTHYSIYILGFIFGIFFTKTFAHELKNDTKEYDFIMYQFYKASVIGYKFRFILFMLIGPMFLLIIFNSFLK
ncbi:hypothetical protein BU024_10490 [Staphylococcus simulans]|nr:hypothetical protein BU024_10490 [Staphylococcus simulans]